MMNIIDELLSAEKDGAISQNLIKQFDYLVVRHQLSWRQVEFGQAIIHRAELPKLNREIIGKLLEAEKDETLDDYLIQEFEEAANGQHLTAKQINFGSAIIERCKKMSCEVA